MLNRRVVNEFQARPGTWSRGSIALRAIGFVLIVGMLPAAQVCAIDLEGEADLKSQYILNFAKLVEWPAEAGSSSNDRFLIGICGDPYLWRACRRELAGEKIRDSRVSLAPLSLEKAGIPAPEMKVLFVSTDDVEELKKIIAALADRPILLISDHPDFSRLGGSIGLVWDEDRMQFEINRSQETRTGFKINSRLLRVASLVLE